MTGTSSQLVRGAALGVILAVAIAAAPRTGCWNETPGSACAGVPVQPGQCPVEIISDGDCYTTQLVQPPSGARNRTTSQVTCTYQKKKKDESGNCTIDDGPPTSYVRSCANATGESC